MHVAMDVPRENWGQRLIFVEFAGLDVILITKTTRHGANFLALYIPSHDNAASTPEMIIDSRSF